MISTLRSAASRFGVAIAVFCLVSSETALAASGSGGGKGNISFLGGLAFPSTSSTVFTYGVSGTYKLTEFLGVGPFLHKFGIGVEVQSDDSSVTINSNTSTTYFGAEAQYFLKGSLKGVTGGIKLGLAKTSSTGSAVINGVNADLDVGDTALLIAPKIAYDYFIGRLSIGGELDYFLTTSDVTPKSTNFLIAAKFWF